MWNRVWGGAESAAMWMPKRRRADSECGFELPRKRRLLLDFKDGNFEESLFFFLSLCCGFDLFASNILISVGEIKPATYGFHFTFPKVRTASIFEL